MSLASLPPSRPGPPPGRARGFPRPRLTSASRREPGQGRASLLLSATSPQSPAGKPQQTRAGPRHCSLHKSGVLPVGRGPGPPPAGVPALRKPPPPASGLGAEGTPCLGDRSRGEAAASRGPAGSRRASRSAARGPGRRCGPGSLQEALPLLRCPSVRSWRSDLPGAFLAAPRGWVTPRALPCSFPSCNVCDRKATAGITWVAGRLGGRQPLASLGAGLRLHPFRSVTGHQDERTGGRRNCPLPLKGGEANGLSTFKTLRRILRPLWKSQIPQYSDYLTIC